MEKNLQKRKKALILASVASMIDQFNMQNIQLLLNLGYQVDVVCNCKTGNTISDERVQDLIKRLADKGVRVKHISIPREITDVKGIAESLIQVRKICNKNRYDLLHCHSPIGSVVARLAAKKARKHGTKVVYTAHGFHFYKGAPKKNWLLFYPVEKALSRYTDVLVTINTEDYEFAKKHMHAGKIEYIPGVGVDTKKIKLTNFDNLSKRKELGIDIDDIMILSVGELNDNKNQEVIIKAIAKMNNAKIHYFIAGRGYKKQYLKELASQRGVNLHLLGYRTDVVELLNTADIYAFPSYREGLSVALMEAMAAGLPCVVSKIRGNVDLIEEGKGGYLCDPASELDFAEKIMLLINDRKLAKEYGEFNSVKMCMFDLDKVTNKMKLIYEGKN